MGPFQRCKSTPTKKWRGDKAVRSLSSKTDPMFRPHRRYLTFSLRTLFILLTMFADWTATIVNRAREQREAVKAIEALGGEVLYGPFAILNWQRTGNDYFQNVEIVKCPVGTSHAD